MNKPLKSTLIAAFLAITLPAANIALAEHGDNKGARCEKGQSHFGKHQGRHDGAPYLHGLDLSSAQEDQLFALNHAQAPILREHHKQHQQLREDMRATAQADKFDESKAQQLADKAAKLEKEKVLAFARHEAKVFALLTPEQRKKAREFKMEQRGFGHHEGRDDDNNRPAKFKRHHRHAESRNI
ncbi:MAG TPA: Spy/CpxP family protein refolding chaperone [Methylotenera sp.]|nr:Spy/CpxP family protein refolding chaperone [Methylotenera sp.]HPH04389.1 Spy/CpxP family protein refolding chaperone [Methylotenera sp.]HPM99943.1 Spy/CpxP family protein refolding chaperone [Methylotenera sp.]